MHDDHPIVPQAPHTMGRRMQFTSECEKTNIILLK